MPVNKAKVVASKENAIKADKIIRDVLGGVKVLADDETWLLEFMQSTMRRLPGEEALQREKHRKKVSGTKRSQQ